MHPFDGLQGEFPFQDYSGHGPAKRAFYHGEGGDCSSSEPRTQRGGVSDTAAGEKPA